MIQLGLSQAQLTQAAYLYDLELKQHYHTILPCQTERLRLWQQVFDPQFALFYQVNHCLIGLAGFSCLEGSFTGACRAPRLIRTIGLRKAIQMTHHKPILKRPPSQTELVHDGLIVNPLWRRRGIGRQLLSALADYAQERGFQALRLDVDVRNRTARQLYESAGYIAQSTTQPAELITMYRHLPIAEHDATTAYPATEQ